MQSIIAREKLAKQDSLTKKNKLTLARLLVMAVTLSNPLTPRATPETERVANIQPDELPEAEAIHGIKIQLYFGFCSDYRTDLSEAEFQDFVDTVISPVFPDLSVPKLEGQWLTERDNKVALTMC